MFPAKRMDFTDSQLIALSTIIENKNQFIRMELIKSSEMARSNFSSEISIPLEKNKSLHIVKQSSTKTPGRPGSVMSITSNPYILEDIHQAMNSRADQYSHKARKDGTEKKRIYFLKYVEWARRAALFVVACRACGLRFPSPDDNNQNDEEWDEYYGALYGRMIE